ncbi:hypothetical protein LCGC14_1831930 [marine sediment metagenome]|uniref:site-specific DNA-methyltransferase (cytosine-N(4)-specific) n=1 Tax=marine sediment metagenome TaxID=412755 RepID=A0A0F9GG31_9ZZZZ
MNFLEVRVLGEWLNKVLCGDCVQIMQQMPSDFVDLVVTSPPYRD